MVEQKNTRHRSDPLRQKLIFDLILKAKLQHYIR